MILPIIVVIQLSLDEIKVPVALWSSNRVDSQPGRSEYKKVWSALSTTEDHAKLHVIVVTEETALQSTGAQTLQILQNTFGKRF